MIFFFFITILTTIQGRGSSFGYSFFRSGRFENWQHFRISLLKCTLNPKVAFRFTTRNGYRCWKFSSVFKILMSHASRCRTFSGKCTKESSNWIIFKDERTILMQTIHIKQRESNGKSLELWLKYCRSEMTQLEYVKRVGLSK